MDAITMLREDHQRVKQLFRQYEQAGDRMDMKQDLGTQILTDLEIHSRLEEEIFYPAVRQRDQQLQGIIEHSFEDHRMVDEMIEEMRAMDMQDRMFDQRMQELRRTVEHHIDEEEAELLPQAQRDLGSAEMDRLGMQMQQMRQQLMQQMRRAA